MTEIPKDQIPEFFAQYVRYTPSKGAEQNFKIEYLVKFRRENWLKTVRQWVSSQGRTQPVKE